ncbi:hypothetical protein BJY16_003767 [Actinoplanes octamycinicus]|uniref:YCII-related domain-containing protein n=1 Tax=Actinoplanes octamycinicus TaxID=135948 RepID=A0A7W7GXY2_9ACTN|nr:YciI family protein [Actinoplanes octamycinicus]MBB4740308.1 hypothetical protein [Actinoplanes octamycinicus]GIE62616.1 hypothetical protein Aoc01nite_80180 [Actinoplanes octamycinicus]
MKFLLLAYTPADAWDAADAGAGSEDAMAAFAVYQKFQQELTETGEFVGSEGLGHPVVSTTVRRTDDGVIATDGPFAELKEVLASYAVIDCVSQERAVEIAGRIVAILGEPIEIRPIMCADLAG